MNLDPDDLDIDDLPLQLGRSNISFPKITQELIASVALGLEDELVIAAKHGFSVEEYQEIQKLRSFQAAVQSQRAEFERSGVNFQTMAALQAAEVRDKFFMMAMHHKASFAQVHDALKTLSKLGNLEPKELKSATTAAAGFSIHIDLGDSKSVSLTAKQPAPAPVDVIDLDE